MNIRYRIPSFVFAVASTVVVACSGTSTGTGGAGSGVNCSTTSPCSADPADTQAELASCNQSYNDATCGAKFQAAGQCLYSVTKCGSDLKTDKAATDAASKTSCSQQIAAYQSCKAGGGSSGSSGGPGASCGTITWKDPACQSCMTTSCCAEELACSNNNACLTILACIQSCGADQACGDKCVTNNPAGQADEGKLATCFNGCSAQCQ